MNTLCEWLHGGHDTLCEWLHGKHDTLYCISDYGYTEGTTLYVSDYTEGTTLYVSDYTEGTTLYVSDYTEGNTLCDWLHGGHNTMLLIQKRGKPQM